MTPYLLPDSWELLRLQIANRTLHIARYKAKTAICNLKSAIFIQTQ